jgi:hypothetical protein
VLPVRMISLDPTATWQQLPKPRTPPSFRSTGPPRYFVPSPDEDRPYISYIAGGQMVLAVEPYGRGWAALWDSNAETTYLAIGQTPLEAMKALRG